MSVNKIFNYNKITLNPVLWLKADKGIHLSGSTIYQWDDQSGHGYNATQITEANQPLLVNGVLNGKYVLRFDGSNDFLTLGNVLNTGTESMTIFVVANNASGALLGKFDGAVTGDYGMGIYLDTFYFAMAAGSNVSIVPPIGFKIFTMKIDKSDFKHYGYVNGIIQGNNNSFNESSSTPFLIGKWFSLGDTLSGEIAEIIVYNSALTDSQRIVVENYLKIKYGL